jgi:3-isopropylmalate/(R)-2-methylmalate dehydratase small subunit
MTPFTTLSGAAVAFLRDQVDTDLIIRVERLFGAVPREDLGRYAFETLRYLSDGTEDPGFPLATASRGAATILLAGENFGCGSSREGAVWALAGLGLRCIVAPSFGEIFLGNCFANGLLAFTLDKARIAALAAMLAARPGGNRFTVDLAAQTFACPDGVTERFTVPALRRTALLEGLDDIALTLKRGAEIAAYRDRDYTLRAWAYDPAANLDPRWPLS